MSQQIGTVTWISGPVIRARGSRHVSMLELVEVGEEHLVGEVIGLNGDIITIQVYEETSGMHPGAPVFGTGLPLSVELGPGLLRSIFDGIQRPLPVIEMRSGSFIDRGVHLTPLYRKDHWSFTPVLEAGVDVSRRADPGHRARDARPRTPRDGPARAFRAADLDRPGAQVHHRGADRQNRERERRARPDHAAALAGAPAAPLQTPPGPTDPADHRAARAGHLLPALQGRRGGHPGRVWRRQDGHPASIAKWSDAQVVVYIGCGERGNEMTEVLQEFPHLIDPRSGRPLMERTVLIANTSNMPVAAREASIYTGITIAEYYRDMGYHVALMADSTSRWAEALREVSGRLEEMPAEEGYPAYLAARLAEFYERAGYVETLNGQIRLGQRHRGGLAARRRLLRAGHPAHQALHPLLLGAG